MSNLRDFKLAALYFDNINIIRPILMHGIAPCDDGHEVVGLDFTEDELLAHAMSSGCFSYDFGLQIEATKQVKGVTRIYDPGADERIRSIIGDNIDLIVPSARRNANTVIIEAANLSFSAEAELISRQIMNNVKAVPAEAKLNLSDDEEANRAILLIDYYTTQLGRLLNAATSNEFAVTNSGILSDILRRQRREFGEYHRLEASQPMGPAIAMHALEVFLPDLSLASFEDILEFKRGAADELESFRSYITELEFSMSNGTQSAEHIFNVRVCPAVKDLTKKLMGLKIKAAGSVIDQLKDPRSYAPLLGTFVVNAPTAAMVTTSLALIGTKTMLDYIADALPLRTAGIFYLLKCQRAFLSP